MKVTKLDILFAKFKKYCKPKQNVTVERYQFNTCVQKTDETIDQYVKELKLRAENCSYGDLEDQLIRDHIVCGTKSEIVKKHLLCMHRRSYTGQSHSNLQS